MALACSYLFDDATISASKYLRMVIITIFSLSKCIGFFFVDFALTY